MQEKNSIKVSLGTAICLVIIFILVIALAGMYVYYNYIPNQNVTNTNSIANNNQTINNTGVNLIEPTITTLSVDNDLVKQLYDYILKFNYYEETLVYQSNKVTSTNIDNQLKLLTAFKNLDESQAKKVKTSDYTGVVEDDGNSYKYLYTKETVEKKVKEIFGENATVVHENCPPHDGYARIYENGIYTCYDYSGGGDVPWSSSTHQIVKAETDGNNIYLYDTYIHIVNAENIIDGINHFGTYDIYATSDKKILIAQKVNLEKDGAYDGRTNDMTTDEFQATYMKNLSNILENKNKIFKHTFSKDSTGNYYWVSTEIAE